MWLGAIARRRPDAGDPLIASVLLFDVVVLTLELGLSGGATNPFAILYLVHILLAGLLLRGRWVIGITLIAAASYAGLVAWPPLARLSDDEQRIGRWVAFGFLAFFTALTSWRAASALRSGHLELLRRRWLLRPRRPYETRGCRRTRAQSGKLGHTRGGGGIARV